MSRKSPRGDDCAPAMFPFLAVLLCTIGALVLILVISVVHSHASAKRDMDHELEDQIEQAKEQSDYLQTISEELSARREKVKKEIDRRRKELANVEDHIQRLKVQMEQLRAQAEGIASIDDRDQQGRSVREAKIQSLKSAIESKQREIASEVEKSKQRKLAFAIIPYDGPNGTLRRPVYLECRSDGVVIQPEGICISVRDLRPPYGPGNPLDAALRVLRTAYQQRDTTFGLTIPPYPLLVVRPDGIHSYAMARAAMSGWDDQFGYELIDAQMPLVFPPGVPNLKEDLLRTLETARQRQEAIVAALPRPMVRARELDDIDLDSLTPESFGPQGELAQGDGATVEEGKEWTMIDELPGNGIGSGGSFAGGGTNPPAHSADPDRLEGSSSTNGFTQTSPSGSMGTSGVYGSAGSYGPASGGGSSNVAGSAQDRGSGSAGGASSSGSPGSSSSSFSRANSFSSGNANGSSPQTLNGTDGPSTPESQAMANAVKEMQEKGPSAPDGSASSTKTASRSSEESSRPIAASKGKGWAMPGKDPKATPVTRPIRIVVLEDRWMVRKEGSETQFEVEIELAAGPASTSAALEKAIRDRVDSWGLSLPGGYWCPSIVIESASDAQRSVHRLQRMLEGSGVDIRVVALQAPTSTAMPLPGVASPGIPNRR